MPEFVAFLSLLPFPGMVICISLSPKLTSDVESVIAIILLTTVCPVKLSEMKICKSSGLKTYVASQTLEYSYFC